MAARPFFTDSARVGPLVERARAWVAAHPAPAAVHVLIAGGAGPTVLAVNQHTTHTKVLNILDHLFRREAGRLVSRLTRIFGVRHLQLVQDVVQDVFCRALEVWKFTGVPDNPSAWLAAAARNRGIDVLRREQLARRIDELIRVDTPSFEADLAHH